MPFTWYPKGGGDRDIMSEERKVRVAQNRKWASGKVKFPLSGVSSLNTTIFLEWERDIKPWFG